jgi:hypothetical protein
MPDTGIDADRIRRTTEEVLSRPEYDLSPREEESAILSSWLEPLWQWLRELFAPVRELFDGWPAWGRQLVVGAAVVVAVVAAITAVRRLRQRRWAAPANPPPSESPGSAAALEARATAAAERGDYAEGVRLLLRASVTRLEEAERRTNRPGVTNRELLRRYSTSGLFEQVRRLVETMDATWYGIRECTAEDFAECRRSADTVREQLGMFLVRRDRLQPVGPSTQPGAGRGH